MHTGTTSTHRRQVATHLLGAYRRCRWSTAPPRKSKSKETFRVSKANSNRGWGAVSFLFFCFFFILFSFFERTEQGVRTIADAWVCRCARLQQECGSTAEPEHGEAQLKRDNPRVRQRRCLKQAHVHPIGLAQQGGDGWFALFASIVGPIQHGDRTVLDVSIKRRARQHGY